MQDIEFFWRQAVTFHGHACPGLAAGCRIAFDALVLMGLEGRPTEDGYLCVAETDACSLDAVQAVWGCTMGRGNLILKPRGKQAFTFCRRGEAEGVRYCWSVPRPLPKAQSDHEKIEWYLRGPADALYATKVVPVPPLPEARAIPSLTCTACGERTAESMVRLLEGRPYCLDCFQDPSRFLP